MKNFNGRAYEYAQSDRFEIVKNSVKNLQEKYLYNIII